MGGLLDSSQIRDAIVDAVREGVPLSTAWLAAGLSRSTYQDWSSVSETGKWRNGCIPTPQTYATICEFCARIEHARAEHEAELVRTITEAARTRTKNGPPDWRAGAWLLEHGTHTRGRYYQHREVQTVEATPPRERPSLSHLSDDEVIELAGGNWRELLAPVRPQDQQPPLPS